MTAYFFDLDGTLVDSRQCLFLSFRAAIAALDLSGIENDALARFLGTPLPEMFRTLKPNVTQAEIDRGMAAFRVAFEQRGIHQNHLYDGALAILHEIAHRGRKSWIVTSKPQPYAEQVVDVLGLNGLVSGIIGAGLDERDTKAGLIGRALQVSGLGKWQVVMIGDRHYDVEGALENQVRPIGVLWGYGSEAELRRAGCIDFARTPAEFIAKFVVVEPTRIPMNPVLPRQAAVR
jgi:phosphoglycolate phosphatase